METATAAQSLSNGTSPCSVLQHQTWDADEQAAKLKSWEQTYQQLTAGPFSGSLAEACFGGVQLFREVTNQAVHQAGQSWGGSLTVGATVCVEGDASFCGKKLHALEGLLFAGGDELDFRSPRNFDVVAATVQWSTLCDYAEQVEHCILDPEAAKTTVIVGDPKRITALSSCLRTALDGILATPELLRHPQLQKALEQAVLSSVIALIGNGACASQPEATCLNRRDVVGRAKAYMQSHVDEPLTVSDLCRVLGVSRRTLQYSFQDVLDLNPVAYLRAMRLNGVRRDLKAADPGRHAVADIAARWGFWHLSHFCADYRRMFGELPSATLRNKIAHLTDDSSHATPTPT